MIERMCDSLTLGDCVRLLEAVNNRVYNISKGNVSNIKIVADTLEFDTDIYTAYCSLMEGRDLLKKVLKQALKQIKKDSK